MSRHKTRVYSFSQTYNLGINNLRQVQICRKVFVSILLFSLSFFLTTSSVSSVLDIFFCDINGCIRKHLHSWMNIHLLLVSRRIRYMRKVCLHHLRLMARLISSPARPERSSSGNFVRSTIGFLRLKYAYRQNIPSYSALAYRQHARSIF